MLSDCLSCLSISLSVCDVGVLWPSGWMDQDETWRAGKPRPGHIVLDGDPAPPKKRHSTPTFRPMSVVAKRLDGSRCHLVRIKMPLGTEVGLIVLDGEQATPTPLFSAHVYCGQKKPNGRPSQLLLSTCTKVAQNIS